MKTIMLILIMLASPALALDPGGNVQGTLDGREVSTEIWAGQSDFQDYRGTGAGGTVAIITKDLDRASGLGTVMISFDTSDFIAAVPDTADIKILIPEQAKPEAPEAFVANLDDGLVLTVTEARREGDLLHIIGTVTGQLVRQKLITKERDPAASHDVSLSFEALLSQL